LLLIVPRISFLHLQELLELFKVLLILDLVIAPDRSHLLDHLGGTLPTKTSNTSTFIHGRSNIVINQLDFVELGLELPVQNQLVLLGSSIVFKRNRLDCEQLIRTKERLSQGAIAPLCLTTNQLGLDAR